MENQPRKHHTDQENIPAGINNVAVPAKRKRLAAGCRGRGALGDVNTNVQAPQHINVGKVAAAAAEIKRNPKINYSHVTSKVDTGLLASGNAVLEPRPTACLPKTAANTRPALKESQNKAVKHATSSLQGGKDTQKARGNTKVAIKNKENKEVVKTKKEEVKKEVIKDPVEFIDQKYMDDVYFSPVTQLPDGIEDIDAKDKKDPLLLSEYVNYIYNYQAQLELQFAIKKNFLKKHIGITGKMRATLIDWLVDVQIKFNLSLDTWQLSVGIIDRYLQAAPTVRRDRLQLIGMTALYVATKYEETYVPDVGDFIALTANAYTKEEVYTCEWEILCVLGGSLARPIPLSFLRRFIRIPRGKVKHHHLAKYFVDLCLVEYSMAHYRPSELAAAAVCLSVHVLSKQELEQIWTPTLGFYTQYSLEHIQPIIRKIAKIVTEVENSITQAVYKKYSHESLAKSSLLPQLKALNPENLDFLRNLMHVFSAVY